MTIVHHLPVRSRGFETLIAETSVDPYRWADVFARLDRLFPGTISVVYSEIGFPRMPVGTLDNIRVGPSFFDGYFGDLYQKNLAALKMWELGVGATFRYEDLWAVDDVVRSDFYRDFLKPMCDCTFGGGMVLHRTREQIWMLCIRAPHAVGRTYDAGILTLLHRFGAHILRAFRIAHALGSAAPPANADIEAVWDLLPYPVTLLTPELDILSANVAAEEALTTRRLFAPLRYRRLRAACEATRDEIDAAVDQITSGRSIRQTIPLVDAAGQPTATIQFASIRGDKGTRFLRSARTAVHPLLIATIRNFGEGTGALGAAGLNLSRDRRLR